MMITGRVIWSKWICNCHSLFPQMLSESWPRARHQGLTLCTGSHFSPGFPQLPAVPPFLPWISSLPQSVDQALYQASDYRPSTTGTDTALFPQPRSFCFCLSNLPGWKLWLHYTHHVFALVSYFYQGSDLNMNWPGPYPEAVMESFPKLGECEFSSFVILVVASSVALVTSRLSLLHPTQSTWPCLFPVQHLRWFMDWREEAMLMRACTHTHTCYTFPI